MRQKQKRYLNIIGKGENTEVACWNYQIIGNTYKTKIEFEKKNYGNKKINNAKDQKQVWKEIKDPKKSKTDKNVIFYAIEYKNDDYQIATQFNNYFVNSSKFTCERFKFGVIITEKITNISIVWKISQTITML